MKAFSQIIPFPQIPHLIYQVLFHSIFKTTYSVISSFPIFLTLVLKTRLITTSSGFEWYLTHIAYIYSISC